MSDPRWEKLRTTYKRAQFVGHHSVCVETSDIFDLLREVDRVRALEAALEPLVARLEDYAATAKRAVANSQGLADHKLLILANYGDLALQLAPGFRTALERTDG